MIEIVPYRQGIRKIRTKEIRENENTKTPTKNIAGQTPNFVTFTCYRVCIPYDMRMYLYKSPITWHRKHIP